MRKSNQRKNVASSIANQGKQTGRTRSGRRKQPTKKQKKETQAAATRTANFSNVQTRGQFLSSGRGGRMFY